VKVTTSINKSKSVGGGRESSICFVPFRIRQSLKQYTQAVGDGQFQPVRGAAVSIKRQVILSVWCRSFNQAAGDAISLHDSDFGSSKKERSLSTKIRVFQHKRGLIVAYTEMRV